MFIPVLLWFKHVPSYKDMKSCKQTSKAKALLTTKAFFSDKFNIATCISKTLRIKNGTSHPQREKESKGQESSQNRRFSVFSKEGHRQTGSCGEKPTREHFVYALNCTSRLQHMERRIYDIYSDARRCSFTYCFNRRRTSH